MSIGFDPEVPAGYQDADLEQAEFEAQGRALAEARRRGACWHGWQQAAAGANDPALAHDEAKVGTIPAGKALCLECGAIVDDIHAARG